MENILIIFIKYPEAGQVKTRLAKTIGKEQAAYFCRLSVEAVLKRTEDENYQTLVFFTPEEKKGRIKEWLGEGLELYPQQGKDLGERLASAFQEVFQRGAKHAVLIGTDSPLINSEMIRGAFRRLKEKESVLGPASDGGYYLLGLNSFHEELFQGVEWGSNRVWQQTLNIFKKTGIKYSLLAEHFDIDEMEDLQMLKNIFAERTSPELENLDALVSMVEEINLGGLK